MPELPEVETIVQGLQGPLLGRTFTNVIVLWPNSIKTPLTNLRTDLPSNQIVALTRRAKYLQFHLSSGKTLFIHLKMSGDLLVEPSDTPLHRHIRTIFDLDNQHQLRFKDMRKFGRVYLVDDVNEVVRNLGPEPLADDFTVSDFCRIFENRRGRLKPMLLNQSIIAGLGNIYSDESCFLAGLHPQRSVDTLSGQDLTRLYQAIRDVLQEGIVLKGASLDEVYRGGEFQNHFRVYSRTKKPCLRCETPIERIVLGGRSTHFCPVCQPLE